jgi:hypothetical protein
MGGCLSHGRPNRISADFAVEAGWHAFFSMFSDLLFSAEWRFMQLGVFLPIGNNGWLISTTSPQYMPTFDLNRTIVEKAERFGFDFALSMIKLHGFGGPSQYWDHNLESFTLMAGLAAVTTRIQLFASVAVLTMPPPITARMARFGQTAAGS